MSLIWGLAFPLPTHLSLTLLGFFVYGIWVLFSWYQSQTKVAAKKETSKQQNRSLRQIRKLRVSRLEETEMNVSVADLTRISGLPTDWTQEYVYWSIERSLRQIFQHLDNARSTLMELNVSESQDGTSSSVSDIVVQEIVPPSCYCKKGKISTDYSMSSASSNNSSSLSYLPMFPEGTAWQFQSDSGPVSSQKEASMPRSPGTSLPTSQLTDPEKLDLSPNLAVLRPFQAQTSFISSILNSLDPWEQEKTKDKGKTHCQSNHGSDSDLDESPGPLVWAPLQLSPLIRGELEGHMPQKVSTLGQQVMPLPVKKSWNILNRFMDVQGVPEEELPKTQLPTLIPESVEQNTNTSPDFPSFHLHMNIGVNSEVHRTEAIISQPFPSNRQSQPEDDRQELRYNPLVISTGTPSPRNLGVNIIQEEQALVKKDSKHVLELNIEQRVIGLPEKRVQTHKVQLTNVELTPKIPHSATDRIKVTPLALLQVMDLMGITPGSQSELIDSVGFSPEPPNQAETVSVTPQPSNQVIEQIKVTHHQHQTTELKSMASRLSQVTDDMKVTPVALFHVTDSMEMIDKLSPHGIEPVGVAPQPQYQVMESVKMDTLHNYQAIRPGSMSRGPEQTVVEAVEMIPQPQHKDMGTLTMTLGSQNQASKHIRITPSPVHQNAMEISSSVLPEATEDTKVSPVAKQVMDVMQIFPLGQPHVTKSRALIRGSQLPAENFTPVSAQPDVPTTTVPAGTVESRSVPPQPPSKVLEPSGMTDDLLASCQSLHALKVTPPVQASPTGMITPLQIVEPQTKESLQLTSGLQGQVEDSVGTTPQPQGTECVSLTPKSHHQIMESRKTIPAPPDQGAVPIGRGQKHQVPEAEVVPVIPLLQEMEYLGGNTIPQPKVRDSMDFPPELLNVKSEYLIPDPRLQSVKSVDITTELVSDIKKYGPPTSTVLCIDLAPELHQQNTQYEELTPIPQLQSETSVPSAPESQFRDVKSGQLTVEPQHQNKKSAELTPRPQLHSNVSVHWIPDSQSQGMEEALSALSQDIQGDIKMVELTPRPSLEGRKSVNLAPCSQSTGSDKIAPVPLLEDTETPLVEGRSLIPEALVESMEVGELIPSTHFYVTQSSEATPKPSYHFLEPEGLTLQHPASEARVTSDPCQQVEESAPLPQSSLGMTPAPLSQTSESVEMSSPPLQDTLEPGTQVVKEMEETPESGSAIKDTLDLLLDSEVQTMTSGVMAPEPQPPDVKFVQVPPEPCAEVTNPSERTLKPEHEDTKTFRLTVSKVDDTQGTVIDLYSEVRSLEFSLEPGVQGEKSESFAQNLKSAEVITEPPLQVVEPTGLIAGPKPHIKDVIPRPQLQEVKSRQMDRESQLQNENSVNVIQPSSAGEVDPEKTKPEPRLQSLSPKERIEGTQPPNVKSVDFKCVQFMPGVELQDRKPQGLMPESFLPLSQETQVEDKKRVLPPEVSEFCSMKRPIPASELQHPRVIAKQVNPGLWHQDTKFSGLASRPKLPGVRFGEQTPGSLSHGMSPMTPELGIHDPKSAKATPGLQDTRQVSFNSGPWLQDVKFFDVIPGTQPQGVKTSELNSGPQLECVKIFELTTQPERQGMKPELTVKEPPFKDIKYATRNLVPNFEGKMSYKLASEPQIPKAESKKLTPGKHLAGVDHSELIRRTQAQGVESSTLIHRQHLEHIKPVEKIIASKQEELMPGPHLEDRKSVELRSKSELGKVKSMLSTPGIQAGDKEGEELPLGSNLKGLKYELPPSGPQLEDRKPAVLTLGQCLERIKSTVISPSSSQLDGMKSVKLIPGSRIQDLKTVGLACYARVQDVNAMGLELEPKKQGESPVTFVPGMLFQDKAMEVLQGPYLQDVKPKELTSPPQTQDSKRVIISCLKQQSLKPVNRAKTQGIQGVKFMDLVSTQQYQGRAPMDLTLEPGQDDHISSTEWKGGMFGHLNKQLESEDMLSVGSDQEPKPAGRKPIEFTSKVQRKDAPSFELAPEPVVHKVKAQEGQYGPQVPSMRPCPLTPESQVYQVKDLEPMLEPPLQDGGTVALNTEPQIGGTKSVQWIPVSEFQREKCIGSNFRLQSQSASPTELKPSTQRRGVRSSELTVRSKIQGEKSREFHLESKLQQVKTSALALGLQKTKTLNKTSEPQPQGIKTDQLNKETQVESVRSIQWTPRPEFHGVTFLKLNSGSPSPGVESTEGKPSIQLRGGKTSEMALGPKPQGKKSVDFNLEPQVQCVKTLELSPGPELQEGENITSTSELQSQCVKSVPLLQGPQLENTKSDLWIPLSDYQFNSSTLNLRLPPQDVTAKELKPSVQLDVKTSDQLTTRLKSQGKQPSGSTQEHQSQRSKSIDFNSEQQFRNTKACDPNLRSKINNIKLILKPRFCLEDRSSPGLNPGIQPQEVNPLVSSPGTQPQTVTPSVFKQESQSSEVKYGAISQRPQSQNNVELKCGKSSELALQTKPRGMKSEKSSGPQWQCAKCFDLTPEIESPNMKCTKLSCSSQLKGKRCIELATGTKTQRVKLGCKPGPQWQGIKSNSFLRTKPQEMEMEDWEPGPQLQDLKSSRIIMGIKVHDDMSVGFGPGPHLQGMTSEVITGKRVHGMKSVEIKPSSKLQGKKHDFTPRKMFLGTKSVELDSGPPLQDLKYPELIMGMKLQGVNSMGQHVTSIKSSEVVTQIKSQGVTAVDLNSGPQTQNKKPSELVQGKRLLAKESVELNQGPKLHGVTVESKPPNGESGKLNSEFAPGHCSQRAKTSFAPKPCVHERKPMQLRLGSQQQSMDRQQFPLNEKPVVSTPESTGDFIAGPALSSVKFSNLIPESQQQCMKSTEFTSEPKWQSINHVKLSSVSLPQTGTSRGLSPRPFLQNVTPGNQNPQTRDQIIESSQVIYRPGHQLEDYAEKMRHQVPKFMDFISLPVYQDAGSSEMTKGLGHKSPETTEKSTRLTPKPTDQGLESLGMPQQLDLQGQESVDLTPKLSDQDSKSSELTPQRSYWSPETLQLLPCLWPQFKDFKELPTEQATESDRMTLDLKNHVAEVRMLTCEVRPRKEFLSVTSNGVNRETGHVEKSPRSCPQDLGPVVVSSGKRSQREHSVTWPPRPSYHVPDSASGITPGQGPQIPESVSLTSEPWLQIEESLDLSTQQTSQVVEDTDCEELTFESWQPGEVASRLTKPQGASLGTLNITPVESLDQMINFITISPKPLNQVTESAKTRLHVSQSDALPSVSKSVEVISGPPLQVIESVMIPEPASQGSKHADLTPKLHDVIMSEFASSLWLQNVQSRKLIAAPTHQILETTELAGFQVIKTILVPKPLLLIVKSEKLPPGPNPQAIEPVGVATKSSIKVMDGLNLLPRPHLQDMVKPMEQTPRANIQENFAELILEQTSPLEEPPVLTHEQRLQAEKSLGIRTESPKVMEIEDLNQRRECEDRDSEMITSEKLQAQNSFSRFIPSPSIPFISSSFKTTELGPLQGSGMPEVSRALAMKNFTVGILPSPESYTDTIMFHSSALPLVLPSDIGNTVGTLYPDIWEVDVLSEEATKKKQMEEFGNSFQSCSPDPLRLLPSEFQVVLGARRNSIRSFLGRQQNVWKSHVCRQRLPRKYLSNMPMLGNVLGTTMERKLCPQPFLTEEATMDSCQFIQSSFGVPAELMAFSQSLLERGPRTISQTSVVRNYIQRRILCHGHKKRMPLKMWTRGSTSSIIQQYSGTRLGIKKTNSKLSDIFEEVTQNVSVSCTRAQFPALMKPESSLKILYNREDPVSSDQSKDSQSDSPTRTFGSHHSLKARCLSEDKRDISEQLHLLKDLQLKIAAKLLESQVPHNVPPPFSSGVVLKYPICLQCGQCSEINCCHKLQSAFDSYLFVYPQIHLLSTPEGHAEIRLRLGFRLRTWKRPQVSKHRGRKRAHTWKSTTSPSRRKAKIYPPASKSPTTPRDFQARSSQASVQVQRGSHGVVRQTDAKDSEHHEFSQLHSVSKSGFESIQEENRSKSRLKKTFDLNYPKKETIKGLKTQNTKLYKNSETPEESPFRMMCPSRSKSIETVQTSTVSSKTQPKKSSQSKFYQLLFQGLRQAFQIAHRIAAYTGQKPEDRTRPDNLWSTQYLHHKQRANKYCLAPSVMKELSGGE